MTHAHVKGVRMSMNIPQPMCILRNQNALRSARRNIRSHPLRHERHAHPPPSKPAGAETNVTATPLKERILSIPGPSWFWTQVQPLAVPFRAYSRAQSRHPYAVQIFSSLVIYFLGDLSSQFIQRPSSSSTTPDDNAGPDDSEAQGQRRRRQQREFHYDPDRSLRALVIGGIFSLPSYSWFMFLSRSFNVPATAMPYSTAASLVIKVVVNQIVFAPLFNTYFFGMQSLLSDYGLASRSSSSSDQRPPPREDFSVRLKAAWERVKETVPISWYNSCKFWPVVTAFSFTFVKPQSRSVFAGVVAIGWQSYLGIVNQRAVERAKSS